MAYLVILMTERIFSESFSFTILVATTGDWLEHMGCVWCDGMEFFTFFLTFRANDNISFIPWRWFGQEGKSSSRRKEKPRSSLRG